MKVLDRMESAGLRPLGDITMNKLELSFDRLIRIPRAFLPLYLKHLSLTMNHITTITMASLPPFRYLPSSHSSAADRLPEHIASEFKVSNTLDSGSKRFSFTVNATLDLSLNPLCHLELGALSELVEAYGEVRLLNTVVHRRGGLALLGVSSGSTVGWFDIAALGGRYRWLELGCCCPSAPCRLHDSRLGPFPACRVPTTDTGTLCK